MDADGAEDGGDEEAAKPTTPGKYTTFWKEFGKLIKLGIIEDSSNRQRLAKLLRFSTSKSPDALTSLEAYVERMQPTQKHIYFLTGEPLSPVTAMLHCGAHPQRGASLANSWGREAWAPDRLLCAAQQS